MSTLRANTLKPITSGNSLVLQGDSGGSGVTGLEIDSTGKSDFNGKELILDVDGDTSITADTDDQIDFRAGGSDSVKIGNEHLTINDGNLVIGTAGHGIDFTNATDVGTGETISSSVLSDYEEGEWSPELTDDQSTPNEFTYNSTPKGKYTKIGDLVTVFFQARTNGSTSGITTSDQLYLRSLPFINESTSPTINAYSIVRMSVLGTNQSTVGPIFARLNNGTDSIRFEHQFGDASAPYSIESLLISEFEGGSGAEVQGSLTYKTT